MYPKNSGALFGRMVKVDQESQALLTRILQSQQINIVPGVSSLEIQGLTMRRRFTLDAAGEWWSNEKSLSGPLPPFTDSGR
jgi:hypothetical protein